MITLCTYKVFFLDLSDPFYQYTYIISENFGRSLFIKTVKPHKEREQPEVETGTETEKQKKRVI